MDLKPWEYMLKKSIQQGLADCGNPLKMFLNSNLCFSLQYKTLPQNSWPRSHTKCHFPAPTTIGTPHPSTPPTSPLPFLATINSLGHINYVAAGVRCLSVHWKSLAEPIKQSTSRASFLGKGFPNGWKKL